MSQARANSIVLATRLGFSIDPNLPLLEDAKLSRTALEGADRALAMFILVSIANGSPPEFGIEWLEREGLSRALTTEEAAWLRTRSEELRPRFAALEEGLMALMWALSFADDLDFTKYADDSLPTKLPRVRQGQRADGFRARAMLRTDHEILAMTDFAYCLHWAIVDAHLRRKSIPVQVVPYVVIERRRALEWLTSGKTWDEISLDT